ncbi:MAG: PorT family protein [Gemmatimonadetes bacterium]|nr:PorT family protein [Gemmatimonadota bacterium]
MRRHLTSLLAATALLAVPASAHAQIGLGVMAGGSFSNVSGDLVTDAKNTGTFLVGGFLNVNAGGFALQPGLVFARKGFKGDPIDGVTPKNTFDYLQVPLVVRIGMPVGSKGRFYIGAGPSIGVKVGCRLSGSSDGISFSTNCDDLSTDEGWIELKKTEFSGIGEAGLEFGKLSIGVRADLGLSNIYEASAGSLALPADIKTKTISAVVALRF